jgi:CBS domain-containing protein
MNVKDIMTPFPACCTPETPLRDVAALMVDHDCGEIPVVASMDDLTPVGVITDRDIACRAVASGRNPQTMTAGDCMSVPAITVDEDATLEECCATFEANRVRRSPVVDADGRCCGMVAQADIAQHAPPEMTAELVHEVSQQSEV